LASSPIERTLEATKSTACLRHSRGGSNRGRLSCESNA